MAACAPTRAADLLRPAAQQRGRHPVAAAPAAAAAPGAAALRRRQPGTQQQRRRRLQPPRGSAEAAQATAAPPAAAVAAGEVKAVLFDMDGVLCHSEEISRQAACEVMRELYGLEVQPDEFLPFTGTGEANFLGGVARKYGAPFEVESCKKRFFEIYLTKYCVPGCGIEHKGARELVEACRAAGLKTAVASSADRVKVDAQLTAANIPHELFDAIVSADVFERLKPAPDIFLSAAEQLGVHPSNCVVIEDAVAGVQAARAAGMRVVGVTTSLAPAVMEAAAPDLIHAGPQAISIDDILGLKLAQQAQQQQTQQAQQQGSAAPPSSSSSSSSAERPTAAAAPPSSSGSSPSSSGSSNGSWLDGWVDLPAGYRTTRRDALKFLSLGGAFGSLWVGITRAQREPEVRRFLLRYHIPTLVQLAIIAYVASGWQYFRKSLSYVSPQAVLNALLPQAQLPAAAAEAGGDGGRVAAFKRYIADLEKRGGGTAVPEFPAGADWLNAPPLRLSRELRGKVTVLDFWTYCCINCMHILPDLAFVEKKYAGTPFAVVGVHSAKFEAEKDSEAIRSAVLRYEIEHPVVNDGNMTMWRALGVNSWPTLAVVSPNGRLIAMVAGEGHRQDIDDIVAAALEYYGEKGQLDDTPLPVSLERDRDPRLAASPLRFPGKVATDLAGGRLFISDSSNNRIVVTDLKGQFLEQIGCGAPGLVDGGYEEAAFHRPQGVAYSAKRNCLYVADTEAHALREIDLRRKTVKTLAGSGVKGSDYAGGQKGAAQLLNSPWDLALDSGEKSLYIAMAGQHQIWSMDTATGVLSNFSGSGYERNQNGTSALTTAWAQPSGLAMAPGGDAIYVADSESSSVRRLDLASGGSRLLVGGDPMFSDNLFRFGDKDGSGSDALLQHPLAVLTAPDGKVYVADSYNHRLKLLDPETAAITTVAGSGSAGYKDASGTAAQLSEPGGLAAGPDGTIIVADTNNGLIRQFDLRTQRVSTLALANVPPPRRSPDGPPAGAAAAAEPPPGAALVRAPDAVAAGSGELQLAIRLPKGYHLTPGANSRFEADLVSGGSGSKSSVQFQPAAGNLAEDASGTTATATLKFSRQGSGTDGSGTDLMRVLAKVYFCQDRDVCLFQEICFDVPLAPAVQPGQPAAAVPLQFALSASAPVVQLPGL